jgi:hypothetical protein
MTTSNLTVITLLIERLDRIIMQIKIKDSNYYILLTH